MQVEHTTRVANSFGSLEQLLAKIESGREPKPDWIRLQADCRLDRLAPAARRALLSRLHRAVRRGFRTTNVRIRERGKRLDYWRSIAGAGFHDFSDQGWMKCFDSPFVESHDYVAAYLAGGLDALDPYAVYSAVLGTYDFAVEDFVATALCRDVRTIVEPMAGTAEFSYRGHFRLPDFRYVMIDLDAGAQQRVLAQPWLPETEKHYLVADVLDEEVWKQVKAVSSGPSLGYVGKQSHHLFDAKQMHRLMDVATRHVDFLMLETPQLAPVLDMGGVDDLTRPEMRDAGFRAALIEDPDGTPNPFTNRMHFHLGVADRSGERRLFGYRDWTVWSQPILVTLAELLGLRSFYFHSELYEFSSVHENTADSDVEDNVTFMLFTRHEVESPV